MKHKRAKEALVDFVEQLRTLYPYKKLLLLETLQENLKDFFVREEEILELKDYLLTYEFKSAKTMFYDDVHQEVYFYKKLLLFSNLCWFADRLEELNLGLRFSMEEKSLLIKRKYLLDTLANHPEIIEGCLVFHKTKPLANKIPKKPPAKPRYLRFVIILDKEGLSSLRYPSQLLDSIEKTKAFEPMFLSAIENGFRYIEVYAVKFTTFLPSENILSSSPRFDFMKFKGENLYISLNTQQQKLGFDIFLNKRFPFFFRAVLSL